MHSLSKKLYLSIQQQLSCSIGKSVVGCINKLENILPIIFILPWLSEIATFFLTTHSELLKKTCIILLLHNIFPTLDLHVVFHNGQNFHQPSSFEMTYRFS